LTTFQADEEIGTIIPLCCLKPSGNWTTAFHPDASIQRVSYRDSRHTVEPHDFTLLRRSSFSYEGRAAVVSPVPSAEPVEACPPSPRLRRTPARIPPQRNSRGFPRRRVNAKPPGMNTLNGLTHMGITTP
jgi:hypothetical protein